MVTRVDIIGTVIVQGHRFRFVIEEQDRGGAGPGGNNQHFLCHIEAIRAWSQDIIGTSIVQGVM